MDAKEQPPPTINQSRPIPPSSLTLKDIPINTALQAVFDMRHELVAKSKQRLAVSLPDRRRKQVSKKTRAIVVELVLDWTGKPPLPKWGGSHLVGRYLSMMYIFLEIRSFWFRGACRGRLLCLG